MTLKTLLQEFGIFAPYFNPHYNGGMHLFYVT